jgi:hypothetical protein
MSGGAHNRHHSQGFASKGYGAVNSRTAMTSSGAVTVTSAREWTRLIEN